MPIAVAGRAGSNMNPAKTAAAAGSSIAASAIFSDDQRKPLRRRTIT